MEYKKKKNKPLIFSILAVIIVSIFLYPVVMKNPHIRNLERLIDEGVEGNEFSLHCEYKRGQTIEQITVNGNADIYSKKGVCKKIDRIQKIICQYILKNPDAFNLNHGQKKEKGKNQKSDEVANAFSLEFDDDEQLYVRSDGEGNYEWRPIFEFYFTNALIDRSNTSFNCVSVSPLFPSEYKQKFSELSSFTAIKELYISKIEIDKPNLLGSMVGLKKIYLLNCTGDIEGLGKKAKEMGIKYEIEKRDKPKTEPVSEEEK